LRYEVRKGTDWDTATIIDVVDSTNITVNELPLGDNTFLIKALDTVKNYSTNPAKVVITVSRPANPKQIYGFEAGGIVYLKWGETADIFRYEVRYGPPGV